MLSKLFGVPVCMFTYISVGLMDKKSTTDVGGEQMERERYCSSVWDSGRMAVGDRLL